MKSTPCLAAALLVAAFSASADAADSLKAKPGAWEMTVKSSASGAVVPPEALAKMPPERRAMVEKMMAEGRQSTHKTCVTKEDLDRGAFDKRQSECKVDVITRTPTKLVAKTTCPRQKTQGTMQFEAPDPEHIIGTIDQEREGGGKFHVDIAGKWLSASCDGTDAPPKK